MKEALGQMEDVEMSMRKGLIASRSRIVVLTTIAALLLTTSETPLSAAPAAGASQGISTPAASGGATEFSSRSRHRHYRHGGDAAGAAFMGLAFGAIAGAIAAQQRRDEYDYYYGYSGPGYYAPGPYYGPGYGYYRPHYYHPHYYRPF
jgi:hypothetical protein